MEVCESRGGKAAPGRLGPLAVLASLALAAGCTERLTVPGDCPEFCPGGQVIVSDTVLEAITGSDSSFFGYGLLNDGLTIQVANGGDIGEVIGVARFIRGTDSVFLGDTAHVIERDSIMIQFSLVERDRIATGMAFDFYRLPATTDSLISHAEVAALLTPDRLLRTVQAPATTEATAIQMMFQGSDLDRLDFTPADSGRLVIAVRMRADQPGVGAYLGGASGGSSAPIWYTYGRIDSEDTTLVNQTISRVLQWQLSVYERGDDPIDPDLLVVGGPHAARALIRFSLPPAIKDSATILRATLELVPDGPVHGITDDSLAISVLGLLSDFGAKSSVVSSNVGVGWLRLGTDTMRVDIAPIVALWQRDTGLPSAIRVQVGQEYSSLMSPQFRSTRSGTGAPRLRITYRRPFPFGEF